MEDFVNNMVAQAQAYGPGLIKAALVFIAFLIVAYIVSWLIAKAIDATGLAKRANQSIGTGKKTLGASLASAAKWIIILIGLIQALAIAGATDVSEKLSQIVDPIVAYTPNIFAAILVFALFMIVATVVKLALKNILVLADGLPEKFGLASGPTNISGIVSYIAFGFLALTGIASALNTLGIETISRPVNDLIASIVGMIGPVALSATILTIFVIIGRFVADLLGRILPGTGIDGAVAELGILKGADKGLTASSIIAKVSLFVIVLLGLTAALRVLGIGALTEAMDVVLAMATKIIFGSLIIFAGVFVARLVTGAMAATGSGASDVAANVVKWIIIILSVILGISRMGLDPTGGTFILHVAEYLVMGGAAALALAFGWGGRDWAARQLENWRSTK